MERDEITGDGLAAADDVLRRVHLAYRTDHARLWRSLYAFSGDRDVADEAAAEAFTQVLRGGAGVHDVRAWVWRAAFAIARGELQARRRRAARLPDDPLAIDPPPDDALAAVLAALEELSDEDRELLVLCHVGGWKPSELASILDASGPTLRVRLHRATRRARRILERA